MPNSKSGYCVVDYVSCLFIFPTHIRGKDISLFFS